LANYDHIELTEDEIFMALHKAKGEKDARLKTEAYKKKLFEVPVYEKMNFEQLKEFVTLRYNVIDVLDENFSQKLPALINEKSPYFILDDNNREIFNTLCLYYSGDKKFEENPELGFHKDVVVVNDAATTIKAGTVMGKVTATGKWKVCKQAASDGSQNASGVYVGNLLGDFVSLVLPATTDTKALVLVRGPAILANTVGGVVSGTAIDQGLIWDASFTTQAQKDAAFAAGGLAASLVIMSPQV